ncbi:hypothetical protein POVCU1_051090 [Plasmodium ovale curtisi]|uniref:PIR Superfamily Protein n=1 Tax=Plasmodium ovale curtisi TaxID=864141 RepID=A0A1A8X1N8_PLAOA|nr:hypothetical protein POVCU1_051090 [Plasmodium ovale curtisi]
MATYSEVNDIIADNKSLTDAYAWMKKFKNKFDNNLEKHNVEIGKNTLYKSDYEYANVKDKKCVDDIAAEIIYIEPKKNEINRSLEYNLIKKYSEEEIIKINSSYEADIQKYKKFLKYYEQHNFDNFKKLITKIECTSGDVQESEVLEKQETPVDSFSLNIFIVPILSLWGYLLIYFFLYKEKLNFILNIEKIFEGTHVRSWFHRKIWEKIIF